jgi:uncharacterized low-complexity protein
MKKKTMKEMLALVAVSGAILSSTQVQADLTPASWSSDSSLSKGVAHSCGEGKCGEGSCGADEEESDEKVKL